MSDLEQFKNELGDQLVLAARRRNEKAASSPLPRRPRVVPIAATALVLVLGSALSSFFRSDTANAEVFEITSSDRLIRLEIVDLIGDTDASEEQLRREVGLESDFIAVPTDPALVGRIVALGTTGSVLSNARPGADGYISAIELPSALGGSLTISFGRSALAGERYEATTTHPRCAEFFGQTLDASITGLRTIRPTVTAVIDTGNGRPVFVDDLNEVPDDNLLVDVQTVSDDSVEAWFAQDGVTSIPIHEHCLR